MLKWFILLSSLFLLMNCDEPTDDSAETNVPVVAIITPQDGATITESLTIFIEATDSDSIVKVVVFVDELLLGEDTKSPYSIFWEIDNQDLGVEHTIFAKAYDAQINIGISETIIVTVDVSAGDFTKHMVAQYSGEKNDLCAIDIDGDQDMDILGVGPIWGGTHVYLWVNDRSKNFTEIDVSGYMSEVTGVDAVDLDLDGDMDILGSRSGEAIWWENTGNLNFTKHIIASGYDLPWLFGIFGIDMDSDGDIDITGATEDNLMWWENNGTQGFTKHLIGQYFNGLHSVYPVDLDNDTDIDLLVSEDYAGQINWWENNGNQNFIEHNIVDEFSDTHYAYPTDVDGDGDIDVVGAANDGVNWYENDGYEQFTEHIILEGEGCLGPMAAFAIDVDNDGDVDVMQAGDYGVDWFENDGNQVFSRHPLSELSGQSIIAADLDGDGDIDIIAGTYDILWWENIMQ